MFNRILIPLDGSELAETVVPYVQELAHKFGSAITLLQVVDYATAVLPVEPGLMTPIQPEVLEEAAEAELLRADEYLANLRGRLRKAGLNATYKVERGDPADEIIRYAKEWSADLIAMSTHGRSGLVRLVFGSVANEVLRNAGTPILLIRPQGR
ncbi:MAG: universal stress protein [Chloroflexota bacterium]|nr:MAG: universal stress protein [Chloroflexota bacterium]